MKLTSNGRTALYGIAAAGTPGSIGLKTVVHNGLQHVLKVRSTMQPLNKACLLIIVQVFKPAGEPASSAKPKSRGPVRVHTHTTICAHSPRNVHKIKTCIVNPLRAGPDGHARLDCNYSSFCGELDARLHALDNTMSNVRQRLKNKLHPACRESVDRRGLLNKSLLTQMTLSTAVFGQYCQSRPCCGKTSS